MAAQPRACASVGASKLARNQSRTAGEKGASGSATTGGAATGAECTAPRPFRPDVRFRPDPTARAGGRTALSGRPHGRIEDDVAERFNAIDRSIEKDAWCGRRIGKGRHTK